MAAARAAAVRMAAARAAAVEGQGLGGKEGGKAPEGSTTPHTRPCLLGPFQTEIWHNGSPCFQPGIRNCILTMMQQRFPPC